MKKNKNMKKLLSSILAFAVALTLSSCNNGNTANNDNPPPKDLDETPVSNFEYKYDASFGGVVITKYTGTALKVYIPEKIDDYPVTAIGAEAFKDSGIAYVYIPDSVTYIGANVFIGCNGLDVHYPEGANIKKLGGIYWRVLEVKDGKALLITESIIEKRAFRRGTYLSEYLNDEFYNNTFSQEEKKQIAETTVTNGKNPDTTDKIFLLSEDEVKKYFADNEERVAYFNSNTCGWWLRLPIRTDYFGDYAAFVQGSGRVGDDCPVEENEDIGVRPALWLNLQS